MQESMTADRGVLRVAVDALLLRDEAFHSVLGWPRPFVRGLVLVVAVALIVALASLVGTMLAAWSSPDLDAIQDVVSEELVRMPWYEELSAEEAADANEGIEQGLDIGFGIAKMFMPSLPMAFGSLLFMPLVLMFSWIVIAVVVHIVARILEGEASLAQTFGAMALAVAPQLLGVVKVLPFVQTAGLTIWSIIISYLAVKHVHGLSANRAFWVLLIAGAAMFVVGSVIGLGVGVVVALAASTAIGAGS